MRKKSLGSRESVLRVAAEMFSENGYRMTKMQDLAERLNVSKPTLYANIGEKEEILAEIIKTWIFFTENSLRKALKANGGPRERLVALVHDWCENAVSQRAFHMVFLTDERELPDAIVEKYRRWQLKAFRKIRELVEEGQAVGIFRPNLNPTVATFSVIAFINALPKWFDSRGALSIHEIASQFISIFDSGAALHTALAQHHKLPRERIGN